MITYIIKSGEYYTIGKTKNLKKRLKTYRTHNPIVKVIKVFDGDFEKDLHNRFQEKRIDKREWFILSKRDIKEICSTHNNIWKIKEPDIIVVPNKKVAFILRQIIIGKQIKVYNEFYNLPHKLDENFFIRRIYPDFIDVESWLSENTEYTDIVNSTVKDYFMKTNNDAQSNINQQTYANLGSEEGRKHVKDSDSIETRQIFTLDEFFEIYGHLLTDEDKYKVLQEAIKFQEKKFSKT